jgi:hypothetical protein
VKPPPTLAPYVEATALAISGSLTNAAALWLALLNPLRRCCGVGIWAECYPVALWLAHLALTFGERRQWRLVPKPSVRAYRVHDDRADDEAAGPYRHGAPDHRLRFLPGTPYFLAQRRAVCLLLPPLAIMARNCRRFLNGMPSRPC